MKKIILSALLMLCASAVLAESTPKKPSCKGFVSNSFWSNWELSGGIGVNNAFSNGGSQGPFGQQIGFEGNIAATKWVHPVAGLRLQFQGGYFNSFDPNKGKLNWPYVFVHTDVMINLSNWAGGYREDRAYYLVPFFGFGYMASNFTQQSKAASQEGYLHGYAFTFGLLNKFRISPAVDFNIELKSMLLPSRQVPVLMKGNYTMGLSATAGFTYRFNKRGWSRSVTAYTADDIRAFQQAVADSNTALDDAQRENKRLNDELAAAKAAAVAVAAAPKAVEPAPAPAPVVAKSDCPLAVVLFSLKSWMLTSKELARLNVVADTIKKGPADRVYQIEGHADRQTGFAQTNKRLADERAKGVYNYLIAKGVNPKQLAWEGKGDQSNPFGENAQANRAVIIK